MSWPIHETPLPHATEVSGSRAGITRQGAEWRLGLALTMVVLALSISLATYAYLSTPPGRSFSGVIYNIPDHNQYFAWMRDLSHQSLAANRLTAEPNEPALFHLLWWAAGRAGATLNLTYDATFGALRLIAILILLPVAYAFFHIVIADPAQRRLAMLLFTFGGGMGIIWVVAKYLLGLTDALFPFDIYTAEPNTFFMALAFPHFTIALALVIGVIGLTLYAQRRQQLRYAVAAGVVGALIGLQHAYDLLTIYTVLGLWGLLIWWRDRSFPVFLGKAALIIAAFTIPPAAYLSYLVLTDATWGGKLEQFDNAGAWTPGLLHLPVLLGVPLLLALIAFRPHMLRSRNDATILLAVWFLAHAVLAYLPVTFQIHLLLGWQVPIMALAAQALTTTIWPWLRGGAPRLAPLALTTIVALCVVTNAYILLWRFVDLGRHQQPFYLSQDEVAALQWLERHTTSDDVVLGVLEIDQHVPPRTDARAFLAHWAGTLDYYTKEELAARALDPTTPQQRRRELLAEFAVTYVIVREQDSPRAALAASAGPTLVLAYENATVSIYHVP